RHGGPDRGAAACLRDPVGLPRHSVRGRTPHQAAGADRSDRARGMRALRQRRRSVLLLAAALGAGMLAGCTSGSDNPTIQAPPTASVSTAPTRTVTPTALPSSAPPATHTATPSPTVSRPPSATPTKPALGTATTIQSAALYVQTTSHQAGGPFQFIGADSTWRPAATLHALHAVPAAAAGNGGATYFLFVNGNLVGQFH